MESRKEDKFIPVIAIPPGETIRENMEYLGMSQKELAARLNITEKHLCNVLSGNAPVTYDTALKLESVIGPGAEFWMKLETDHQLNKARIEEEQKLGKDLETLAKIPYKEMSNNGWIDPENDKAKKVMQLREYFGVGYLYSIQNSYSVAFRTQRCRYEISDFGVLAWLRKAETEGQTIDTGVFNKTKLRKLIPEFRKMTLSEPEEFFPGMRKLCADAGVALVLVKYIPKTYICGATIWRKNKAIVALSVRGKRADVFWFTLFHEIVHLLNHSGKALHVCYDKDNIDHDEEEADSIAADHLIPRNDYDRFVDNKLYENIEGIARFASEIGIAPYIVVGRLMHDGHISYAAWNHLIPSFDLV